MVAWAGSTAFSPHWPPHGRPSSGKFCGPGRGCGRRGRRRLPVSSRPPSPVPRRPTPHPARPPHLQQGTQCQEALSPCLYLPPALCWAGKRATSAPCLGTRHVVRPRRPRHVVRSRRPRRPGAGASSGKPSQPLPCGPRAVAVPSRMPPALLEGESLISSPCLSRCSLLTPDPRAEERSAHVREAERDSKPA